ncbi:MAG: BlaI/MecI/CopY family transcriptional regulator [Lachnospiraceae bacterium]|nr:BlaI/MecI/CopY family transcriptional regulator [Lachnospiraceae bacterium]MCI9401720.1 BlaI/MecI/CopY family transcriptional regulator [Lachnospiraceae bacterium]
MNLIADENKIIKLSSSERDIMELFWNEKDGLSFGEIINLVNQDDSNIRKKQTINTYLTRLIAKNLLIKKNGDTRLKTLYFPKYTKEEYNRKMIEKLLEENYENSLLEFIKQLSGGEYLSKEDAQKIINVLEKDKN